MACRAKEENKKKTDTSLIHLLALGDSHLCVCFDCTALASIGPVKKPPKTDHVSAALMTDRISARVGVLLQQILPWKASVAASSDRSTNDHHNGSHDAEDRDGDGDDVGAIAAASQPAWERLGFPSPEEIQKSAAALATVSASGANPVPVMAVGPHAIRAWGRLSELPADLREQISSATLQARNADPAGK